MLGTVDGRGRAVVADFEAGIGTLTRLGPGAVDAVLVVVEPTPKSLEVGSRAADLAREKSLGRVVVVANRVRSEDDLATVRAALPGHELVLVPDDPAIVDADRAGLAPIDLTPGAPAVAALAGLAENLLPIST